MIRLLLAAAVALLAAATAHAQAQTRARALLIGVSYPELPVALQLEAPEEDADRLAAALVGAGMAPADVTVLSQRRGAAPTRAAVLAALDRLAREARAGDRLLVYFSGHGAQAPTATPALEPDGLDELYLMHDARGWDGGRGEVSGAILDKEWSRTLDAIRARGADVWFVADACHAGGLLRGGVPAGARAKAVPPAAGATPYRSPPAMTPSAGAGRLAAFYAAAPGALALERRLPPGSPDARPLSQFSYALVRALGSGRLRNLRDLSAALLDAEAGLGGDAPEPLFEGSLDLPVLGLTADRPRSFALARSGGAWRLAAGLEEGLMPGDRLALSDTAGAAAGAAEVVHVGLGSSTVRMDTGNAAASYRAVPVRARPGEGRRALLAAIPALDGLGVAADIAVEARVWRPGDAAPCARLQGIGWPNGAVRVDPARLPVLGQCDVLLLALRNGGPRPVDLTPLHVDAAGRAVALNFLGGEGARVPPGGERRVALRLLTRDGAGRPLPTGVERLSLIALPAGDGAPRDLRASLADTALRSGGAAFDDGAGSLTWRWRTGR